MNLPDLPPRDALRAFELFLRECCLDRRGDNLPLRELVETEDVGEFHAGLENLLRGLLVDYSLEQRSRVLKEQLRRSVRRQCFH